MLTSDAPELTRQPDYAPGEVLLGKYELVERLAVGGMGAVWRAKNRLLDSDVAVKLMFRATTGPAGIALQRAHTEARLAAQLQHPAVCTALDFGISDRGDPLVVTELLRGQSLDEVLREGGRLSAVRAVQLLLPVLDGLGAAHAKGIVHRDLKPANIFLARVDSGSEQPKLLDFGIARGFADKQRITVQGVVCGTPDYMSPEQARGSSDVDLRSDLWSFCATLYELVTARVPFAGDNYNAVMFAVAHDDPTPIGELADADRGLCAILERGLKKAREQRFQSTRELAKELSLFLLSRGVEVDACGHSLRSRLSSPEITLTEGELALVRAPAVRESQLAPTMRRSVLPALRLTGVPRRSKTKQAHKPARRRALATLAFASLLGLGAWSSRSDTNPTNAQDVATASAITSEPLTIPLVTIEGTPSSRNMSTGGGDRLKADRSQVSQEGAGRVTLARASTAKQKANKSPTAAKSNALGYDFGL